MDTKNFIGRSNFLSRARTRVYRSTTALFSVVFLLGALGRADDTTITLGSNNGSTQFGFQNSSNIDVVTVNSLGSVVISSNTVLPGATFYANGLVLMGQGTPTISGAITAECTNAAPTLGAGSTNNAGTVTCVTSASAGVAGVIAAVTPTVSAPHDWICNLKPANVATAVAVSYTDLYVISSSSTWTFESTGLLTASTTFVWNYICGAM